MRFLKYILIAAVILAVPAAFVAGKRYEMSRPAMHVNGEPIAKRDLFIWLNDRYGPDMSAKMVNYYLIRQAADKAGWKPKPAEYEKQMKDGQALDPRVAAALTREPWRVAQTKQDLEERDALVYLLTKDVKVTEDEIRDFFDSRPGAWNVPEKLHTKVMLVSDPETADKVKTMMERVTDVTYVQQQFPGKAAAVGADGTWVLTRNSNDAMRRALAKALEGAKPDQVRVVRVDQKGLAAAVVKLVKIEPGKKVSLADVRTQVEQQVKLQRTTPVPELRRKLWDAAKIETDPPTMKDYIELRLFPNRAQAKQASAR